LNCLFLSNSASELGLILWSLKTTRVISNLKLQWRYKDHDKIM
jgi:hypothetical protein